MKILLADIVYYYEHKPFDENIICDVSKICDDIVVLSPCNWYSAKSKNLDYAENMKEFSAKGRFLFYLCALINTLKTVSAVHKYTPDVIILMEYEILVLPLLLLFKCCKSRIAVIHHINIDTIVNSRFKRFIFNRVKRKVDHFVLEPFIENALTDILDVNTKRIICIPHPMPQIERCDIECEYDLVGLSQSNDDAIIKRIIDRENKEEFAKKSNIKIVLKSKSYEYDDLYLKVIKGWIDKEQYDEYICKARCILIPFPNSFKYRVSASIMEAVSLRKSIIASDIPLTRYYYENYPNICRLLNVDTLEKEVLLSKQNAMNADSEMKLFEKNHSSDFRTESMRKYIYEE